MINFCHCKIDCSKISLQISFVTRSFDYDIKFSALLGKMKELKTSVEVLSEGIKKDVSVIKENSNESKLDILDIKNLSQNLKNTLESKQRNDHLSFSKIISEVCNLKDILLSSSTHPIKTFECKEKRIPDHGEIDHIKTMKSPLSTSTQISNNYTENVFPVSLSGEYSKFPQSSQNFVRNNICQERYEFDTSTCGKKTYVDQKQKYMMKHDEQLEALIEQLLTEEVKHIQKDLGIDDNYYANKILIERHESWLNYKSKNQVSGDACIDFDHNKFSLNGKNTCVDMSNHIDESNVNYSNLNV